MKVNQHQRRSMVGPRVAVLLAVVGGLGSAGAGPLGTAFTYQGTLVDSGVPVNGAWDVRFRLYDAATGVVQIGPELCADNVAVVNGGFVVSLDFGAQFAGTQRFLEVEVRPDSGSDCSNAAGFLTLSPRQELTPTPNALFASTAESATVASNATTASNATQLNGQPSSFYKDASTLTGTLPSASLAGTYSAAITLSNAGNALTGSLNGNATSATTATTATNALQLNGQAAAFYLSATNLSSGTLADARLSTNVAMRNAANTFSVGPTQFAGNLGIGRAPGFGLDLGTGTDRFSADTTSVGLVKFGNLASDSTRAVVTSLGGADVMIDGNNNSTNATFRVMKDSLIGGGTELLSVNEAGDVALDVNGLFVKGSNGFVGVSGNVTPAYDLDVGGGADKFSVDVGTAGYVLLGNISNDATTAAMLSRANIEFVIDSNNNDALTRNFLFLRNGVASSSPGFELMRLQEDGRLAIGTSSPDDTVLHTVTTSRAVSATVQSGTNGGIALNAVSTGTGATIGGSFSVDGGTGTGVYAIATAASGVSFGVKGYTSSNAGGAMGVRGEALVNGANYGVYGVAPGASSFGVYANGRLGSSGTKSFMIDHPLDPANKVLLHYSLESPEVLNVYTGVTLLNAQGEAWITLPDYFEAINVEPRYQLTSIGAPGPMLYVAEEIANNRFKVAGGAPNAKVSWEVKAKRNDRFVQQYGAPIEREKREEEKGLYLRPELYGQPEQKGMYFSPPPALPHPVAAPAGNRSVNATTGSNGTSQN